MAKKLKIKKGDQVVVTGGRDKGKRGEVPAVLTKRRPLDRAGREHGAPAYAAFAAASGRHRRQGSDDPRLECRAYRSQDVGAHTRIGYKTLDDGRKVRFAKRSGEVIDR